MNRPPGQRRPLVSWLQAIMLGVFLWAVVLAFGVWIRWPDRYRSWRAGIVILAAVLFIASWNVLLRRQKNRQP